MVRVQNALKHLRWAEGYHRRASVLDIRIVGQANVNAVLRSLRAVLEVLVARVIHLFAHH